MNYVIRQAIFSLIIALGVAMLSFGLNPDGNFADMFFRAWLGCAGVAVPWTGFTWFIDGSLR